MSKLEFPFFKADGLWFLPTEPDKQVAGSLSYSENGIRLALSGSFGDAWAGLQSLRFPEIRGLVNESPGGKLFTLLDCMCSRLSVSTPGFAIQTYDATRAYFGEQFLDEADRLFTGFAVAFRELPAWHKKSNISSHLDKIGPHRFRLSITFETPEPAPLAFGDCEVELSSKWSNERVKQGSAIVELPYLAIRALHPSSLNEIIAEYVRPLEQFIAFAVGRPNPIVELTLFRLQETQTSSPPLAYRVIQRQLVEPVETEVNARDVLFTYTDALQARTDFLAQWLQFFKLHREFCNSYYAHLASHSEFIDQRFLAVMRHFELYFRSVGPARDAAPVGLALDLIKQMADTELWLEYSLPDEYEVRLPWSLMAVLEANADLMAPVVGRSLVSFVNDVVVAARYWKTRVPRDKKDILDRGRLLQAIECLSLLLRICVLRELGFESEWVKTVVERSSEYQALHYGSYGD